MRTLNFYLVALATSLLLATSVAADCNQPEIKASLDFEFFDAIKMNALRPAIQMYVLNKVQNQSINAAGSGWTYSYNVTAENITVRVLDFDWDKTHFLMARSANISSLQITNLNVNVTIDTDVRLMSYIHCAGQVALNLSNINLRVDLTFEPNTGATNYYASINNAEFSFDKLSITHTTYFGSFFTWIASFVVNHLAYGTITSTVTNMITGASDTLRDLTKDGIQITKNNFTATIGIPSRPIISMSPQKKFMTLGFQVSIVNSLNNATSPAFYEEFVADTRDSGQQLQLMFATNVMNQIGWAVHQTNMIDVSLSNKDLPPGAPISLNTTALKILLPQLADQFGMNKGIYFEVKSADEAPKLYVRDGRIIAVVSTTMDFWVDTVSDPEVYPNQGLKKCTTCKQAVSFNSSLIVELNVFKLNRYKVSATVLNIDMVQATILKGTGFNPDSLRGSLNNLFAGLLPTVNAQLKPGFAIPLIGFLGLQDIAINVNKNYLALELSFKPAKKL